ncbi:MAG: aminopeptidase P family protein [Candidatus Thorarchaeota archaeon]|nr:aminopeptidase P family protein [Candidatus Thorarchaeota archaeon]
MLEDLNSLMQKYEVDAIFAYGSAFEVPDIFWLTGFRSPDRIGVFQQQGKTTVGITGLKTLDRLRRESMIKDTYDATDQYMELITSGKRLTDNPEWFWGRILGEIFDGKTLGVPDSLPAFLVVALQKLGYDVKPVSDLFLEGRATKSDRELGLIRKAGDATMGAISQVIELVKETEIGPNKTLMHKGTPLTVSTIKLSLDHFLLDQGAESAEDSIVAVGEKGFDWHYLGNPKDKLKAEMPIIIDVFPRLKRERYIADVTRTAVKGTVSKKLKDMFEAVHAAHMASVDALTAGVQIDEVNMACYNTLQKHGYKSRRLDPTTKDGMTHGLGHGIGLDVHEQPSTYDREGHFEVGHVTTIEPGVYFEGFGGVRIEDDYAVTTGRAKHLTKGIDPFLFL